MLLILLRFYFFVHDSDLDNVSNLREMCYGLVDVYHAASNTCIIKQVLVSVTKDSILLYVDKFGVEYHKHNMFHGIIRLEFANTNLKPEWYQRVPVQGMVDVCRYYSLLDDLSPGEETYELIETLFMTIVQPKLEHMSSELNIFPSYFIYNDLGKSDIYTFFLRANSLTFWHKKYPISSVECIKENKKNVWHHISYYNTKDYCLDIIEHDTPKIEQILIEQIYRYYKTQNFNISFKRVVKTFSTTTMRIICTVTFFKPSSKRPSLLKNFR